jgi:hypothetical protein
MRKCVGVSVLVALVSGCTAVNVAQVPSTVRARDVFIISGDLNEPYESLGLLQVTRKGVVVFGGLDAAGTNLAAGFQDMILHVRQMGGDGAINVQWHQIQYTTLAQVFSIFLLGMLPGEVTITGEVVRLRRGATDAPGTQRL